MKKVLFPATNRVHKSRQKLLLDELEKEFDVHTLEYPLENYRGTMADKAIGTASFFVEKIQELKPDLLLIRGDRFEMLPIAMIGAYLGVPIAHIEGGDLSSVIDGKVRHSISHLADYHFPTNQDSHERLVRMGIPMSRIWNFGSLDAEFATKVKPKTLKRTPYILVAYHPIEGEDAHVVSEALETICARWDYEIVLVASNSDYGEKFGSGSYGPEDYINLIRNASCCVGNSSSFFKEASVFGTPVVNVGQRQNGRLRTKNILDVPCSVQKIQDALEFQLGNPYDPDLTYYQPDTAKNIAQKIKEIL